MCVLLICSVLKILPQKSLSQHKIQINVKSSQDLNAKDMMEIIVTKERVIHFPGTQIRNLIGNNCDFKEIFVSACFHLVCVLRESLKWLFVHINPHLLVFQASGT